MNAMSTSIPTGRSLPPPAVEINAGLRNDCAAVLCSFNGVQHRAVVELGDGNRVEAGHIADMLEALASRVRAQ